MKKIVLILSAFLFINSYSQNKNSGIDICIALKGFNSSLEAENTLDRILSTMGGSKNFVMQECSNVANASALQVEGIRYIFYNQQWMRSLNNSNSNAGLFTLAHEVGHHINGHALDWLLIASKSVNPKTLAERRKQELEADEFAAFVIAKLGVSINDANDIMNTVSNDSDDTFSSHPARAKRLIAIKKGYDKAKNNNDSNYISEEGENNNEVLIFSDGSRWEGTSEEYYLPVPNDGKVYIRKKYKRPYGKGVMYEIDGSVYKGTHYGGFKSGYGEMNYIDGSIYRGQWLNGKQSGRGQLVKPNGVVITVINGISEDELEGEKSFELGTKKYDLEDYQGAIVDFTKSINLNYNKTGGYYFRGQCKGYLEDYKGAIEDFDKLIFLDSKDSFSYYSRAGFKLSIDDYKGALNDYTRSIELDENDDILLKAKKYGARGHCKENLEDYKGAIIDFDKAIELDKSSYLYYFGRGKSKYFSKDWFGAMIDLTKSIELGEEGMLESLYFRGACKYKLEDYVGAIEDYTKAIELDPNDADTYFQRGASKYDSKDFDGAVLDFTKAISIEPNNFEYYKYRGSAKFNSKPADYKGAIDDYTMALKINPTDIFCLSERGRSKHDIGDYSGAILDYTKAIAIDSNHINSYITRGSSKNNSKDYAGAIADYNKAIEINPNNPLPYYNRAIAKENIKDYNGACSDLRKAKDLGMDFDDEDKLMLNKVCK